MVQKSILEQALLQVKTLEDAVKANAKGILASTMKQELKDLLKETTEKEVDDTDDVVPPEGEENDVTGDEPVDDNTSINDGSEEGEEVPSEEEDEKDSIDDLDDETPMDDFSDEDVDDESDDVLDMTGSSDEEVLKVFKAMKPEDGIVVKKDGANINFSDGENEYIIKTDDNEESPELPENLEGDDDDFNNLSEQDESDEETVYEIELDEDDDEEVVEDVQINESAPTVGIILSACAKLEKKLGRKPTTKEVEAELSKPVVKKPVAKKVEAKEGDVDEASRTLSNGWRGGLPKMKYKAGNKRDEMNEEVETLKKQNSEYRKALILFKDKLNEVAIFNANLAYATRLFTEGSTTKQEKLNILKRFDSISTITESKNLYITIKSELENKKPVTESVAAKIISTPKTSTTETLSEAKSYENPQFTRMKDLMKKVK